MTVTWEERNALNYRSALGTGDMFTDRNRNVSATGGAIWLDRTGEFNIKLSLFYKY